MKVLIGFLLVVISQKEGENSGGGPAARQRRKQVKAVTYSGTVFKTPHFRTSNLNLDEKCDTVTG